MSGRALQILGRFPAHMEAARPGKRLGEVTSALARPLDLLSAEMAAVRNAHRPGQARELVDLLRLAALHGLGGSELDVLWARLGNDAPYADRLAALRRRLLHTVAIHRRGNGTVRALLEGTAAVLGMELEGEIVHDEERFWHAAFARDRLQSEPPQEVLGLEENPRHRESTGKTGRRDGETWRVLRRGFGPVDLRVRIHGLPAGRTVAPMLVGRDEGRGIAYAGTVGPGQVLEFTEEGRALLDGADVTSSAWSWEGACFADRDALSPKDFVFDQALFAVATPAGAFDPGFAFPGPGVDVPPLGLSVGETRFAFFVQTAHFSDESELATPRTAIGFFDGSVFAPPPAPAAPSADVELSWLEHEAYAVRVLVPGRFADAAGDAARTAAAVGTALRRFRPAGVDVRVEFLDEHWVLGESVLPDDLTGPLAMLRPGTVLDGPPPDNP
ncbi:MAG TPA: hypothetical protein VMW27_24705 [Thermoanaerobaculia bacterium]|nr:hypothetical protein [Thermoanaerobaculia bacterium]